MTIGRRSLTAAAAVTCALLPAAGAVAATREVTLGLPKAPSGLPAAATLQAWFPNRITVNVGDTVAFRSHAFGYPVVGKGRIPPLAAPDPSAPISGASGPDGQPLWFNGQPSLRVDPFHLAPTGDRRATGKGLDAAGLSMEDGAPKPYEVRFTRRGRFRVRDGLHPDVRMTVVVVPKGRKVPGRAADRARVAEQAAELVARARRLARVRPGGATILAGNDSRDVGFQRFFPGGTTVRAGEPIRFRTGERSLDLHDLVIGPMEWLQTVPPFEVAPPNVSLAGIAVYPSRPPSGRLTFDGSQNGGFLNTGAIDADPRTDLPGEGEFTITRPGTYRYVCLFHWPDMKGTIEVDE